MGEWDTTDSDDDVDEWKAYLDELHLPDTKPGMNFHADFGFVHGSEFCLKTESGKTITSIDGKNSYCLIVDQATRYIWVYIGDSKEPPVEAVRMILAKFGAKMQHIALFAQIVIRVSISPRLSKL